MNMFVMTERVLLKFIGVDEYLTHGRYWVYGEKHNPPGELEPRTSESVQ